MPLITEATPAKIVTVVFLIILLIFLIAKLYIFSEYTVVQLPLG